MRRTVCSVALTFLLLAGCTSSRVFVDRDQSCDHPVRMIAIDPESGAWGDAVAEAITRNCGIKTRSRESTARLTEDLWIGRSYLLRRENMRAFASNGIDAYLFGGACWRLPDGRPLHASVYLRDTYTGRPFLSVRWHARGRPGACGRCYPSDRNNPTEFDAPAREVAAALCDRLRKINKRQGPQN
jgi:hypothetical protein